MRILRPQVFTNMRSRTTPSLRSYVEFFNVLWKELLIVIIRKSKIRGKLDRLNSPSPSNPELRRGQPCSPSHQPSLWKPRALRGAAVAGVSLRSRCSVPPVRRHVPIIHGTGYRTRERMPCDQTQGPKPHPSAITVHLGKASYGVLVKLYQLKELCLKEEIGFTFSKKTRRFGQL